MERHRIEELFSQELLDEIVSIIKDPNISSNNEKAQKFLFLLKDLGFTEIGPGTNRLTVRNVGYVYKIAFDSYGIRDNWNEFNMSPELQPFVTKTYETNGIIAVAEYINLITKEQFLKSRPNIKKILDYLSKKYLFCDISCTLKNLTNWGYDDDYNLKILDYGYIYPIDMKIMFCTKCGGKLVWTQDYSALKCVNCGKLHDPIEIRDRMWKKESQFKDIKEDDGKILSISFM